MRQLAHATQVQAGPAARISPSSADVVLRQALSDAGVLRALTAPRSYAPSARLDDGVLFAESPLAPGVPVVVRTRVAREAAPERLNLDRRNLSECCALEGEERLRLLNYQYNAIGSISRLRALPNLVFLDLYQNQLEDITGLDAVPLLRVLMLGRNRLRAISGLSRLRKLDVLDLHSNLIERIDGLDAMPQLRILNLAGNAIGEIENLHHLFSLAELNLRRNVITSLAGGERPQQRLPANLERLYLSHNRIEELSNFGVGADCSELHELALDGNPIAVSGKGSELYRALVIAAAPNVNTLDLTPISEVERTRLNEQVREGTKLAQRETSLETIRDRWEAADASLADGGSGRSSRRQSADSESTFAEVDAEDASHLRLFGDGSALVAALERHRSAAHCVSFDMVPLTRLQASVTALRRMPNLRELRIGRCGIDTLQQLDELIDALKDSIEVLRVDPEVNPVARLRAFRLYVVRGLPSLATLNGVAVTAAEGQRAERAFSFVGTVRARPTARPLSEMNGAAPDSTPGGRASATFVSDALRLSLRAVQKMKILDEIWPEIALRLVREGLTQRTEMPGRTARRSVELRAAASQSTRRH